MSSKEEARAKAERLQIIWDGLSVIRGHKEVCV